MRAPLDWVPVTNSTAEVIPPGGLMRVTGLDEATGHYTVAKPDRDGDVSVLVNGLTAIPASGEGQGTWSPRCVLAYDSADGAPIVDDAWGAVRNSWLAGRSRFGFLAKGGAGQGLVNAIRATRPCCPESGGGGGPGTPSVYAVACDDSTATGDQSYTVVYRCAQIDRLPLDQISFFYIPTASITGTACETAESAFTMLSGSEATRFLATATIDSYHYCCDGTFGGADGAEVPASACVQLLNGRRAYASIASTVYLESAFDGYGYPINYTTPNGKVEVSGRLVFCRARSPEGWYFAGAVYSKDKDPNNPTVYGCGCDANFKGCSPDANGLTQQITAGPVFSGSGSPSQTLKLTTPCGTLEIKLAGPFPCSPPPPAATYNCISGRCVSVADGTGTFASLSACLTSGCAPTIPLSYNCIAGRCVDPLDGTGTFESLSDCELSPCSAPVTYNCDANTCVDPLDGTGTYTGFFGESNCNLECFCCVSYLIGKTATLIGTNGGPITTGPATAVWEAVAQSPRNDYARARFTRTNGGGTDYIEISCGRHNETLGVAIIYVWSSPSIPDWAGGSDPRDYRSTGPHDCPAGGPSLMTFSPPEASWGSLEVTT